MQVLIVGCLKGEGPSQKGSLLVTKGLKDWTYETVDANLETMGNRKEHGEWPRTVRDSSWGLDGMD